MRCSGRGNGKNGTSPLISALGASSLSMKRSNFGVDGYGSLVEPRRAIMIVGLILSLLVVSFATEAQPTKKPYRIGYLAVAAGPTARTQSFLDGLRDLGYVEGRDFVMEYRRSGEQIERLPELAADLVRINVDVIVAATSIAALPAKAATGTIPIVFAGGTYPVERGLVASLARPGGNVTGITNHVGMAKHLQLLKEIAPRVSRVAYFYSSAAGQNYTSTLLAGLEADARAFNVKIDPVPVRDAADVDRAFSEFSRNGTNGLLVDPASVLLGVRDRVCGLALKQGLAVISRGRELADAGCLASYGENSNEVFRRAATYVDRILKGTKPADLPVEQPARFELVINMKTARALGLTIPPSMLMRADQLVE
jgi:putative tryptophan/tyrosine transport system substrate-binding protein